MPIIKINTFKMVTNRYTTKETKEFNKCFNEMLNYINKLKLDDLNKNEKKRINKIHEQTSNCKRLIEKKNIEKKKDNKLNHNNIFMMDVYNIENNKTHLNILSNDIKNQIILQKEDNDNILIRCSKIWNSDVNEKIKNEYKKLTKDRIFTKCDYEKLLLNN